MCSGGDGVEWVCSGGDSVEWVCSGGDGVEWVCSGGDSVEYKSGRAYQYDRHIRVMGDEGSRLG